MPLTTKGHVPGECEDCRPHALARNNYFTGKLLVERDFTDEQRYFREKIRLHHQRLHGTGVVCGLRLKQHPNPKCRDRLIVLEPGTAIDCCGHDIFVLHEEVFDFSEAPEVKALAAKPDGKDHVLEFCLEYRECPTEDIPVLYDECGCDDTQCAPNRILESFEIKVRVDESKQLSESNGSESIAGDTTHDIDCRALLSGGDCPSCNEPDSLVLATVDGYQPGDALVDTVDQGQVYLVFFDWEKFSITPEGMQIIQEVANQYKANATVQLQVTGYTDLTETEAPGPQRLSERRANAVALALTTLGVPRSSMNVSGRGMNDPRVPTPSREPQNRRVEIVFPSLSTSSGTTQALIDNDSRRVVLPSTQAIVQALKCLMDRTLGYGAPQSPAVSPGEVAPAPAPAPPQLTHITKISWPHASKMTFSALSHLDLAFDGEVRIEDFQSPTSVMILVSIYQSINDSRWRNWADLYEYRVQTATATTTGDLPREAEWSIPGETTSTCTAVRLQFTSEGLAALKNASDAARAAERPFIVRVLLNGDFLKDANGRGIDADNLPPWVPHAPSGDGVAGGLFESWFELAGD
jgi:outer membrane protein OmpA-like peptidoglycan-associated protein